MLDHPKMYDEETVTSLQEDLLLLGKSLSKDQNAGKKSNWNCISDEIVDHKSECSLHRSSMKDHLSSEYRGHQNQGGSGTKPEPQSLSPIPRVPTASGPIVRDLSGGKELKNVPD